MRFVMKQTFTILTAFCMASSKLLPMAITSPTLFMLEPSESVTRVNFLRSQRGTLATR